MQTADWQFWFSDRLTGARNPARLSITIQSRRIRCAPPFSTILPAARRRRRPQPTPPTHLPTLDPRCGVIVEPILNGWQLMFDACRHAIAAFWQTDGL